MGHLYYVTLVVSFKLPDFSRYKVYKNWVDKPHLSPVESVNIPLGAVILAELSNLSLETFGTMTVLNCGRTVRQVP